MGNRVKTGAEKIGSSFGNFIIAVLRVFSKFLQSSLPRVQKALFFRSLNITSSALLSSLFINFLSSLKAEKNTLTCVIELR